MFRRLDQKGIVPVIIPIIKGEIVTREIFKILWTIYIVVMIIFPIRWRNDFIDFEGGISSIGVVFV